MKLELNIKEWLAIYGLLERQVPSTDKQIVEVHNRMKSHLVTIMQESQRDQFETWFQQTGEKVADLESQKQAVVDDMMQLARRKPSKEHDTDVDDLGKDG